MKKVTLLQLPIPQQNFAKQTGNIPLAAAWLKQACLDLHAYQFSLLPESLSSYLGDAALVDLLLQQQPDWIAASLYCWNSERTLYILAQVKAKHPVTIVGGGPEAGFGAAQCGSVLSATVSGEGELTFRKLLQGELPLQQHYIGLPADSYFCTADSPYLQDWLEPSIENMMLLETQRGCPYHCGFCYYHKSREKLSCVQQDVLLKAIRWAYDRRLSEVYLLDPSLNTRPFLLSLLKEIATINQDKRLRFLSEIRAEAITPAIADAFAAAHFSEFELGLQSTNPLAQDIMNRPTDLDQFLKGIRLLQERAITPKVDLIIGLPGDTLKGFKQSVNFIAQHNLQEAVQVFPLSVLPGTTFSSLADTYHLTYTATAPYTIRNTASFQEHEIFEAFQYAEDELGFTLHALPDLDIPFQNTADYIGQLYRPQDISYYRWLHFQTEADFTINRQLYRLLTQPYQLFFHCTQWDWAMIRESISIATSTNPYTPLELIFIEPDSIQHLASLIDIVALVRPHFLDNDLRYLYPKSGNRACLITLVSKKRTRLFWGTMRRQVFWWCADTLPNQEDLSSLDHLDGILIDGDYSNESVMEWQNQMKTEAFDYVSVSFARSDWQQRWKMLLYPDAYWDWQ